MRTSKSGVLVLASVFLVGALSGCATKKETGTAVGATVGGAIGYAAGGSNRAVATVVLAILGGAVGNAIGSNLDDEDRKNISVALDKPTTKPTVWVNQTQAHEVIVIPSEEKTWKKMKCRDWTVKLTLTEKSKSGTSITKTYHTTSCKIDGKWVEMIPKG
ncbi:MAG: glycine zipper domain-containing protein [Patescibacteria group bacterium]